MQLASFFQLSIRNIRWDSGADLFENMLPCAYYSALSLYFCLQIKVGLILQSPNRSVFYLSFPLQVYASGNKKKGSWFSFPDVNSLEKKTEGTKTTTKNTNCGFGLIRALERWFAIKFIFLAYCMKNSFERGKKKTLHLATKIILEVAF